MNDTEQTSSSNEEENKQPQFHVLGQYIKDFSFENPNAPKTLQMRDTPPQINVNVSVNGSPLGEGVYLCDLTIEATAGEDKDMLFNIELVYAGIIKVENVPEEQINALILIEGPRFLFPFAREIIGTITRQGGYPPLLLDPIDFVSLYQKRANEAKEKQSIN